MASLIDPKRRDHYEALQVQKRRADKINQICFIIICAFSLETVIELILAVFSSGSNKAGTLIDAILFVISVICAILGCAKRNVVLNLAAILFYLAGFIIGKDYQGAFVLSELCLHLIPYGGTVYANYMEHQLRQEEGYPQFDLSLEEQAMQEAFAQQTSFAALNKQKNTASAPSPMHSPHIEQPSEKNTAPPDMDSI